jgi:hypothetical protein
VEVEEREVALSSAGAAVGRPSRAAVPSSRVEGLLSPEGVAGPLAARAPLPWAERAGRPWPEALREQVEEVREPEEVEEEAALSPSLARRPRDRQRQRRLRRH